MKYGEKEIYSEKRISSKARENKIIKPYEKRKTLQEWKDIDWFKPIQTEKGSPRIQGKAAIRRELLKPLVTKGTSILKEEENIKTRIAEEYKRKLKLIFVPIPGLEPGQAILLNGV